MVAVNHPCPKKLRQYLSAQRIEAVPPNMERITDDADPEGALLEHPVNRAKAEKCRLDLERHVACELPGVSLGASDDDVLLVEKRRHDVQDTRGLRVGRAGQWGTR